MGNDWPPTDSFPNPEAEAIVDKYSDRADKSVIRQIMMDAIELSVDAGFSIVGAKLELYRAKIKELEARP